MKTVRLKGECLWSLIERLRESGFVGGAWQWEKPDAALIDKIALAFEPPSPKWVFLHAWTSHSASAGQLEAALANLRLYLPDQVVRDEQARNELERELLSAQTYWNQTVKPYIQVDTRSVSEWWIARDARDQLRDAAGQVRAWNQSQRPIAAVLPDLDDPAIREPTLIVKDPELQRLLVSIPPRADLPPDEAAERRFADIREGQRLFNKLPDWAEIIWPEWRSVAFSEIIRSNETHGQMPLLPPVEADGAARLSKEKIEVIVIGFLKDRGAGQDEIDACRSQSAIPLPWLCRLRRERFDEHGHSPRLIARIRGPLRTPSAESLQKQIQATQSKLAEAESARQQAEIVAALTLEEALRKWMRFDPRNMKATTKARIESAVKTYITNPELRSLAKIAEQFSVSRKTVSAWFARFTEETGFRVVRHVQHEGVEARLRAEADQKRQQEGDGESGDEDNGV